MYDEHNQCVVGCGRMECLEIYQLQATVPAFSLPVCAKCVFEHAHFEGLSEDVRSRIHGELGDQFVIQSPHKVTKHEAFDVLQGSRHPI